MKNVRKAQLKKSIFLTLDEFQRVARELGFCVDVALDGISFTKDEDEEISTENVYAALSDYFDVHVTSVHCDDCDFVGVWVVFSDEEERNHTDQKEFEVCFAISGHLVGNVKAADFEEAKQAAGILFSEADFGELENADGVLLYIEDANGVRAYEK